METSRIQYMDLPILSSRSLSASSASSSSDLGFCSGFHKRYNSSETHSYNYISHSLENLSNYSSDSCLSDPEDHTSPRRNKIVNIEEDDLSILAAHYYKCKDKKQRNSESVAIECAGLQMAEEKNKKLKKRNKSLSSITKLLKSFSFSKSTKSLNNTPVKQKKKSTAPKTIYRRPVEYVYVKGMSGLATQRIPRSSICCQYS